MTVNCGVLQGSVLGPFKINKNTWIGTTKENFKLLDVLVHESVYMKIIIF